MDTDDDVFDDTDWHHIAMVRVGTAVTIYVDGVLQATTGSIHANRNTHSGADRDAHGRTICDSDRGADGDTRRHGDAHGHAGRHSDADRDPGRDSPHTAVPGVRRDR